jgi:hypothetical protein
MSASIGSRHGVTQIVQPLGRDLGAEPKSYCHARAGCVMSGFSASEKCRHLLEGVGLNLLLCIPWCFCRLSWVADDQSSFYRIVQRGIQGAAGMSNGASAAQEVGT